jgi:hypothetical protein
MVVGNYSPQTVRGYMMELRLLFHYHQRHTVIKHCIQKEAIQQIMDSVFQAALWRAGAGD